MPTTPTVWSLNGLAVELKIYNKKLGELLATLPPDQEDAQGKRWLMSRVVNHLIEKNAGGGKKLDRTEEDARLKRVQAELKEMDLAIRRSEMVPTEIVGEYLDGITMAVKQRILAIPKRTAPVLAGKNATQIETRLKKEVNQALSDLSKLTPDGLIKAVRRGYKKDDRGPEHEASTEQ